MTDKLTKRLTVPSVSYPFEDWNKLRDEVLRRFRGQYVTIAVKPIKVRPKTTKSGTLPISKLKAKVWTAFSALVRHEAEYRCEIHERAAQLGIILPFSCTGAMQTCHKYRRGFTAVMYHRRNVYCGCESGNRWENYHRDEWESIWSRIWPEDHAYLEPIHRAAKKLSRRDYEAMLRQYELELSAHLIN